MRGVALERKARVPKIEFSLQKASLDEIPDIVVRTHAFTKDTYTHNNRRFSPFVPPVNLGHNRAEQSERLLRNVCVV